MIQYGTSASARFISNLKIKANSSTKLKHNQLSFSLLLAPATGVDAASLCPHEVLPRVQSIVHRCGGGAEGAALESISIQNSSSIREWIDCRSQFAAIESRLPIETSPPLTKRSRPDHLDT